MKVFGYISSHSGEFIETGLTERGAKRTATINNARLVGYRSTISNMFIQTSHKENGRWW